MSVGQIPVGTIFVAGSVASGVLAEISYSIDHHKTFLAQTTIPQRQAVAIIEVSSVL